MLFYRKLTDEFNNIEQIILDKNIFGVTRNITIKYKNGTLEEFSGEDEKFFSLLHELKEDDLAKKVEKKTVVKTDDISKIEVKERDKLFNPSVMDIYLASGEVIQFDKKNADIMKTITACKTEYQKYMLDSLLKKYNCTREQLIKNITNNGYLKDDIIKKHRDALNGNAPIWDYIRKHTDRRGREDYHLISSEEYSRVDVITPCEIGELPEVIVVYYKNGRSVTVDDQYCSYKFLKSANSKGITSCNYYPNNAKVTPVNIVTFMRKMDDKFILKKDRISDFFASFRKNKTYKK